MLCIFTGIHEGLFHITLAINKGYMHGCGYMLAWSGSVF